MTTDRFARLLDAYATGRFVREAESSITNRRVVFEDGTVWFPDGVPDTSTSTVTLPIFGALFLLGAAATAVAWHDGVAWTGAIAAAWALTVAPIALTVRAEGRKQREREARLERGVFLLEDALVLKDGEIVEELSRDRIARVFVRRANRGGNKSRAWLHLMVKTEGSEIERDVPTELTEPALATVQAWLERTS